MDHGCDCQCQRAEDRGSARVLTRRGVLAGTAAVTATLALGACADTDDAATPGESASSAPAATDQPTDQSSPSAEASAEPLATTDEFPVGGGKVVGTSGGPVVLTHPTDEEFLAFSGKCTHQGCTVAEVTENTILCTCHGSTFDGSTGDRLEGPAPTGLAPVAIRVDGGSIFLA